MNVALWVRKAQLAQWQRGPAAVQAAYAQVLSGKLDPRSGLILSLATH